MKIDYCKNKIYLILISIISIFCSEAIRVLTNDKRYIIFFSMGLLVYFYFKSLKRCIDYLLSKYYNTTTIILLFILYLFCSSLLYSKEFLFLKFFIYFIISLIFIKIPRYLINKSLFTIINIIPLYSIYLIFNHSELSSFYGGFGKLNYLNITSTSSFVASITASQFIYSGKYIYFCYFLLHLYAIMQFSSVGNLYAPIITLNLLLLLKTIKRFNFRYLLLLIVAFYFSFSQNDNYLLNRNENVALSLKIQNYISNISQTSRAHLWKEYINYITNNGLWLNGIGFHQKGYPHNFALEIIGENGFVGFFCLFAIGIICFIKLIKIRLSSYNLLIISSLIHYLILYSKSFSIYDGYLLFIFISLYLRINKADERESFYYYYLGSD